MKLLTKAQRAKLIKNYHANQQLLEKSQGEESNDLRPVVKLFTPDAGCTWLLTELEPEEEIAFGLCDLGMGFPELGYVSLAEISELRGHLGLPVERDRYWMATGPLSMYADSAGRNGGIVDYPKLRNKDDQ